MVQDFWRSGYIIILYFLISVIVLCLGTSVEKHIQKSSKEFKREHCVLYIMIEKTKDNGIRSI